MEPEPAPPIEGMEAGEEEDEMGELADMPTFSRKDRHVGRGKVIVQSVLETGEGAYEGQEVAKSQADLDAILAAFRDKPLFSKLDDDQHNMVASIMQRRSYAEGEALMNEGENGDTFFIIGSGTCSVEMGGRHLKDMPAGGGFGEIALIYNQPRTSTVVAKTPVEAFTLSRDAYRHSVVESIKRQRAAREQFIAQVKTFAKMRPSQRAKVADALQKVSFGASEQIIKQGDDGDLFYIIEKGDVIITEDDSDLNLVFGAGKFFGEIALTENVPRTSHVHAGASGADCLTLDRSAFNRLFGHTVLDDVAKANEKVLKTASKVFEVKAAADEPERPMLFGDQVTLESFDMGTYVGFGAFGFVRIAKHKETGRMCAIKGMSKGYLISKNQARHAIGERDLLKDCNHPGVVQLYGSFQDENMLYLALEFLNGGELFTLLGLKSRLSNDAARALAAEVVHIFDYIHSKDIIYRDLKPENVMLDSTGHVRLIDFGLAKRCRDRTWTMCGTPEYLAPEVVTNQGHNKSADFWTLGVLIYEMLVGVPPFYDETATDDETFNRILKERPRFPSFIIPTARSVVLTLMEPDITRRLGCMAGGISDLHDHYWFKGLDWASVANHTQEMPFVPKLESEDDLRHFEIEEGDILARKRLFESVKLDPAKAEVFNAF